MRRVSSKVELEEDGHNLDSCNLIYGEFGNLYFYLRYFAWFFVLFCMLCVISYIYPIISIFDDNESLSWFYIISQTLVHLCAIAIITLTDISSIFLITFYLIFVFINCLDVMGSRTFLYQNLFFIKNGVLFKSTKSNNLIFSIQQKEDIEDIQISNDKVEIIAQDNSCNVPVDDLEEIQEEIYGI